MPNDAKTRIDRATHRLQDQPTTAAPIVKASPASSKAGQRQPRQSQQRDTTGTTLPAPSEETNEDTQSADTPAHR